MWVFDDDFPYFSIKTLCCGYSLKSPCRGNSNEHPLHMILRMTKVNEPSHEIMVLITQATREGSGEPARPCSLARAFIVRTHEVWK